MAASQFGEPRGARGWLAAQVVARLTGEANRWMVECLAVETGDRVLDVGCGPALAVARAAEMTEGPAIGVDASSTMLRQARRRNRAAVRQGRVELVRADAGRLPFPGASFTKVGSLNSLQFWPSPDKGLREMHRVLRPGGRVAVVLMAHSDDPAGPEPAPWVEETAARLRATGFLDVEIVSGTFGGVLHHALVGSRPQPAGNEQRAAPLSTPRRTG